MRYTLTLFIVFFSVPPNIAEPSVELMDLYTLKRLRASGLVKKKKERTNTIMRLSQSDHDTFSACLRRVGVS